MNQSLSGRSSGQSRSINLDSANLYECAAVLLVVISRQLEVQATADKHNGKIEHERLVQINRMAEGLRSMADELNG